MLKSSFLAIILLNWLFYNAVIQLPSKAHHHVQTEASSIITDQSFGKQEDFKRSNHTFIPDIQEVNLAQSQIRKLPPNQRAEDRNLSSGLLQQLLDFLDRTNICEMYGLQRRCMYEQKYVFKDAVLKVRRYSTEGGVDSLEFETSIPIPQAVNYAKILTENYGVNMNSPHTENQEYIRYTNPNTVGKGECDLIKDGQGRIKEVKFTVQTP